MEKKIPVKNYIILFIIAVATIVFVIYGVNFYKNKKSYENSLNVRMDFLLQLKENEVKNYITDNHDAIIYISDSSNDEYRDYEKELKKLLINKDLNKEVVYLDVSKVSGDFYNTVKKTYFDTNIKQEADNVPNVWIINEGKIDNVLYENDIAEKKAKQVIYFIERHLEEND